MPNLDTCGEDALDIEAPASGCASGCISIADLANYYTKTQTRNLLSNKQDILDKEAVLQILGYRETILSTTDCAGNIVQYSVLVGE